MEIDVHDRWYVELDQRPVAIIANPADAEMFWFTWDVGIDFNAVLGCSLLISRAKANANAGKECRKGGHRDQDQSQVKLKSFFMSSVHSAILTRRVRRAVNVARSC